MMSTKTVYKEGDWFAVPLAASSYAVGIVARRSRSIIAAGYFFGPVRSDVPQLPELTELRPSSAVLAGQFSTIGLKDGSWPIIGHARNWDRAEWSIKQFGSPIPFTEKAYIVEYDDRDPTKQTSTRVAPVSHIVGLPADGTMGHIYVVERLSALLGFTLPVSIQTQVPDLPMALGGFFDEDVPADIAAGFHELIADGEKPEGAVESLLRSYNDALDDQDDGPIIYLALALLLHEHGVRMSPIIDRAKAIVANSEGLERWQEAGETVLSERLSLYKKIESKLMTP